jgi:hypothetical protein
VKEGLICLTLYRIFVLSWYDYRELN